MEHVEGFELLASTHKHDGLVYYGADREGSTTTGVTIELGEYHTVKVEAVVKLLGSVHGILTGHGIHHEEGLLWVDSLLDGCYLLHHLLIYCQTTSGINDDNIIAIYLGLLDRFLSFDYRVSLAFSSIYFGINLLTQYA